MGPFPYLLSHTKQDITGGCALPKVFNKIGNYFPLHKNWAWLLFNLLRLSRTLSKQSPVLSSYVWSIKGIGFLSHHLGDHLNSDLLLDCSEWVWTVQLKDFGYRAQSCWAGGFSSSSLFHLVHWLWVCKDSCCSSSGVAVLVNCALTCDNQLHILFSGNKNRMERHVLHL